MKARLIYNPRAGQRDLTRDLLATRDYLIGRGWSVDWFVENDARRIT